MEARDGLPGTFRRVGARVYGVANGDTDDCVQEAIARAITSGVSLDAEQWLTTVAKRVAIDGHRRRRETPSGAAADLERFEASGDGDPEESVIRAERSQAVREALAALPARYRKALEAFAEEGSPARVAGRLGLSAAATWTLLSRARTRLKLQLEQAGFVPAALVSASRGKWRELLAAGAAAGVAATAALAPIGPGPGPATTDGSRPRPQIIQTTAPSRPSIAREPAAVPELPVATTDVAKQVDDAVETVTDAPASLKVTTCLSKVGAPLPDVEVEVVENAKRERSVIGLLVETVPEHLRHIGANACA